jgi:kynurenine formamidase
VQVIDLSVAIANDVPADPPFQRLSIDYVGHDLGAQQLVSIFPGLTVDQLPDGKGWAVEQVQLGTHNGTHMDSPWHYHPTMDGGAPAMTIDEVPLDWCIRPGVRLDFRDRPDGHVVSPEEIDSELRRIGRELAPLDIVVCATRAGERYGQQDYIHAGCGFGRAATLHLIEHGSAGWTRAVAVVDGPVGG